MFFIQTGDWVWTDGSAFDFSYWASGEPDNSGQIEHCIEMNFGGFSHLYFYHIHKNHI